MICKPCGVAGDLVAVARDNNSFEDELIKVDLDTVTACAIYTKEAVRSVAHLFHGLCNDCDCQHKVDFEGKAIQS